MTPRNGTGDTARLVMVSNRGPIEHKVDGDGHLRRDGAAGGLATALGCAIDEIPLTWMAGAMSGTDRATGNGRIELGRNGVLKLVVPPEDAYRLSYGTFCNGILWFLQHGLWDRIDYSEDTAVRAWEHGYLPVNQAFAEAAADELRRTGARRVILHDYHLYMAPLLIRNLEPRAVLQHFIHIPWPAVDAWDRLPAAMVASICEGLLANDSVVFQTRASAANFVRTCEAFLPDTEVDTIDGVVTRRGRRTRVWANPVSVHAPELQTRLATPAAQSYRAQLAPIADERTIVRVDRLDPAKNITGGFRAYSLLLERHPEWRRRVRFLAFIVPSRTSIPQYREYADEVFAEMEAVNRRYGDESWRPISIYYEHNRLQALAALSMYDVLLVNSLADGMNLVAKEGAVLNQRDGVLVLSTAAGAFDELRDGALPIDPRDTGKAAEALHAALTLPPLERRGRAERLRDAVLRHGLHDWLQLLLGEFARIEASAEDEALVAGNV